MPYRRLPKTETARLKALKIVLDNSDIYTVEGRFIDWKTINEAQTLYRKLLTTVDQYKVQQAAAKRHTARIDGLQDRAALYVSHFLQVLFMSVERGEIRNTMLPLYGLETSQTTIPYIKSIPTLLEWGQKTIDGEKARIKQGGRPIYNPSIGMVATHYEIFKEANDEQNQLNERVAKELKNIQDLRPKVDEVLLELWNQIEAHYANEPLETRYQKCRELGIVYYYRRHEEHVL